MKTVSAFALVALVLAACAPAAGRPALTLQGTTQDMVAAAATACPTIAPAGYNYLSVENIGGSSVSCVASETTGIAILEAIEDVDSTDQHLIVSFTDLGNSTVEVAISSSPRNEDAENQLQSALLQQFVSVP